MRNKLILAGIALVVVMSVVGCFSDEVLKSSMDGRVSGVIHGVITDSHTGVALDSIKVVASVNGVIVSTLSDTLGYYSITGLPPGEYKLSFYDSRGVYADWYEGHITIPDFVDILPESSSMTMTTEEPFVKTIDHNVTMVAKTGSATGRLFMQDRAADNTFASGVTVYAEVTSSMYYDRVYTTETDELGMFTFTGLPATGVTIRSARFTVDGYSYESVTLEAGITLSPNETVDVGNMFAAIDVSTPTVVYYNLAYDDPKPASNIILRYNTPMHTGSFDVTITYWAEVDSVLQELELPATVSWSEGNMLATIDPSANFIEDTTYTFDISGRSADAKHENYSDTFDILIPAP